MIFDFLEREQINRAASITSAPPAAAGLECPLRPKNHAAPVDTIFTRSKDFAHAASPIGSSTSIITPTAPTSIPHAPRRRPHARSKCSTCCSGTAAQFVRRRHRQHRLQRQRPRRSILDVPLLRKRQTTPNSPRSGRIRPTRSWRASGTPQPLERPLRRLPLQESLRRIAPRPGGNHHRRPWAEDPGCYLTDDEIAGELITQSRPEVAAAV